MNSGAQASFLVVPALSLLFGLSLAWAQDKDAARDAKPASVNGTGGTSEEPVSPPPPPRRKPSSQAKAASVTGRASHREGPPPPLSPPPPAPPRTTVPAPRAEEPIKSPELRTAPVEVSAVPVLTAGPPAPGGTTRREGALEPTSLEDKLLEKGLLSREDWLEIKAEEERRLSERTEAIEFTGSPRWYERLRLYGYFMFRYNRLGNPNGNLLSWQDASVGNQKPQAGLPQESIHYGQPGFFFRRIRTVLTGEVSDRVGVFLQTDFATQIDGNTQAASLVDAWGEYYFDQNKEYRLRIGQQRVPCSFDNWQASRQRMAIDRADATNSCAFGERDLAISGQWTPKWAQHRWKQMIDYMYGAGDWGMVNLSVYNGQGRNSQERNDNKHVAIRLAYPFELPGGRLFEIGMNANRGKVNVDLGTPSPNSLTLFSLNEAKNNDRTDYTDEHLNVYIYYPPQPWGFTAEYITGRTPKRGGDGIVRSSSFYGGYLQGHFQWKYNDTGLVNFYSRWQEYYGGLKFLTGAPDGRMRELEIGAAWMPDPQWEITMAYTSTHRFNFQSMGAYGSSQCTSQLPPTPPFIPDNTSCQPGPQYDAYGNLIRLQVMWFWN